MLVHAGYSGLLVCWFAGSGRRTDRWRARCTGAKFTATQPPSHPSLHVAPRRRRSRGAVPWSLSVARGASLRAQSPHSNAPFEIPAWAFPVLGSATMPAATGTDTSTIATVPTSRAKFTVGRTRDRFDVADWNPATHRSAPPIVMHGRKPVVMACGFCHLADGRGRPENAMVAGLPVEYFVQQVKDMRTPGASKRFAGAVSARRRDGAHRRQRHRRRGGGGGRYFARVRARRASRVVESDSVPRFMPLNGVSTLLPGAAREPLAGPARRDRGRPPAARAARPDGRVRGVRAARQHRAGTHAGDRRRAPRRAGMRELPRGGSARREAGAGARGSFAVVPAAAADRVPHRSTRRRDERADARARRHDDDRRHGGRIGVRGIRAP